MVDDGNRLLGLVTDGDIRRGILAGVSLEDRVADIMNPTPTVAKVGDARERLIETMERLNIRHLPIVDVDGVVTGLFTIDDVLHAPESSTPVILMAGGRGQRLYPLTKDVPKPMLPIGGVPLLEIILRKLGNQGFRNVYISVNYLAEVIMNHVGDGSELGLSVKYIHEDKPLGTEGALASLRGEVTEPLIVMNSDLLTQVNLRELLSFHANQGARATVGVREHLFEIPYGVINLNGTLVESMQEKPMHRSLVNTGIYVLDPLVLDFLEADTYADMPTVLAQVMGDGHKVAAFPIHESWLDVGRPEDLSAARTDSAKWVDP